MRRIPRIRRPSGPAAAATTTAAAVGCQRAAFTQSATKATKATTRTTTVTTTTTTTTRRTVTAIQTRPAPLTRFYSTRTENSKSDAQPHPPPIPQSLSSKENLDMASNDTWASNSAAYVVPPPRSEAQRADEVSDSAYAPATTSEGLESVGGLSDWWESPEHWRRDFAGFRPRRKVEHPALLEAAARRAIIEALALRRAGREADLVAAWPPPPTTGNVAADIRRALAVDLHVTADGSVELGGDVAAVLSNLEGEPPVETESSGTDAAPPGKKPPSFFSPTEAEELRETWDKSWRIVPLTDQRLKFAVTKRIFQLTGQLIPDHKLPEITNAQALLRVLQKPPKPRTLTEEIVKRDLKLKEQQQSHQPPQEEGELAEGQEPQRAQQPQQQAPELTQLPNVTFVPRRVTRGDRETAVGRYKLIEEEFRKRDLPLQGHGFARKNKERSWLRGGA